MNSLLSKNRLKNVYNFNTTVNNYIATGINVASQNKLSFLGTFKRESVSHELGFLTQYSTSYQFGIVVNSSSWRIQIRSGSVTCGEFINTSLLPLEVFFVYDGTKATNAERLICYVNGNQISLTFSGTIPSALTSYDHTISLGKVYSGRSSDGAMYNLSLWVGSALTYAQAKANYSTGLTCKLNLNEGCGTRIFCASTGKEMTASHDTWKVKP